MNMKMTTIYLTEEMLKDLRKHAFKMKRTQSDLIRAGLKSLFQKIQPKQTVKKVEDGNGK